MSSSNKPAQPATATLSDAQLNAISQAFASLSSEQLIWVSGYAAGLAQQTTGNVPGLSAVPTPNAQLTILYGSQTGNAKGVAEQYKTQLDGAGVPARVISMADYKPRQLKSESHVVIIVSTHGEGDAPDDAVELHEFLASKKAPKLPSLKYSVLGLGDSSYEFFCQTAKDFDTRLAALGAKSVVTRVDCDVDYEQPANDWGEAVKQAMQDDLKSSASSQVVQLPGAVSAPATLQYNKKNPYQASLIESLKITGRDSVKDIRHIEISLEDSGIQYRPGDALGVWFDNDPALVNEVLSLLSLDADCSVTVAEESMTLREALSSKLELTLSYPGFVKAYQAASNSDKLAALMEDRKALREFLASRQIVDIIRAYPESISAQQLVDALRPITPRLYSIASAQAEVEDEVHLTVAMVDFDVDGIARSGGASSFLGKRLEEGAPVRVYVENNDNFRLPSDPTTPVIMVGPGTGIAPFRAFMQQRDAEQATGKNWLFFGNPHFTQDFLYQTEWQGYVKQGLLTNISLAFSRDQAQKRYVQHRLLEEAKEVFEWLENGAHFYVCGDANQMAKDVEQALLTIIEQQGGKTPQEAKQYLLSLRKAKRYQKDVY
ncbi:assimilatory sulfite reductase (NADPH) flavoprotein subunit [Aestuariibacter salexigens]|uniref:assimilatory sulfite reductase (NADPH) flavoprotein subunit n=1 Tax=Aestuariibacter salexigens TaxID=226010 RepID=UPI0004142AFF|nr:assimilatory sulfite reductase (NADPH) flavoprotein subunit [Aestuariibacter salexigens]